MLNKYGQVITKSMRIVSTEHRLRKRIPDLAFKSKRYHDYRNSLNTPERKGICDWCNKPRLNPIHRF